MAPGLADVRRAIAGLATAASVPALLERTCTAACADLGFAAASLLRVDGGTATTVAVCDLGAPDADVLRRAHVGRSRALDRGVEADVVRRHQAVVADAMLVVAPVIAEDRVSGLLVARPAEGDVADERHRDALATLADALAMAAGRLALQERLQEQRRHVTEMAVSTKAVLAELASLPVDPLSRDADTWAMLAGTATLTTVPGARARAELSPREREVMRLLAGGATNAAIADRLCLSPETIKTHVARILRKLQAANRAEAVSRFVQSV